MKARKRKQCVPDNVNHRYRELYHHPATGFSDSDERLLPGNLDGDADRRLMAVLRRRRPSCANIPAYVRFGA